MRHLFAAFVVLATLGLARVPSADAQTTAIYFDSQPGDWVGQGKQQTWTDNELVFRVDSQPGQRSQVRIRADNFSSNVSPSTWWDLNFRNANGSDLAPGIYEYAGDFTWSPKTRAGLDISGTGRGCDATGRFVVYEIVFTGAGQLSRFAADFEQHCDDAVPALFGAIRYNSTRSSLNPFDGAYPVSALHLDITPFGRVTGGATLDCGNGGVACDEVYGSTPTTIFLTATPAPGYQFLAWTGDCSGRPRQTTLVVSRRKSCGAVFDAAPNSGIPSPFNFGTVMFVDREAMGNRPADTWAMQPSDADFTVSASPSSVEFRLTAYNSDSWDVEMSAPTGEVLTPGVYERASFFYPSGIAPGFFYSASGGSCSTLPRFIVYDIGFDSGGHLTRFSADFEVHCGSTGAGGVYGAIRYNSGGPAVPFGGLYPVHSLRINPPATGSIVAEGIDCGSGAPGYCWANYAGPARQVAITAVPAPGHIFVGWTGDCTGSSTTSIVVFTLHHCGAVFDMAPDATGPQADELRSGSLFFFSQRGDYIGGGRRQIWTRSDSRFSVTPAYSPTPSRGALFNVETPDGSNWRVELVAPEGQVLRPGDFTGATRYPFQSASTPGLNIGGHGGNCNTLTGRFRIYEVQFDGAGKITNFAADFEQHCEGLVPALFGAIRFNSTRAAILPFDGEFLPRPDMVLETPLDGSTVSPTFAVAGWALNQGEQSGTGVDAVHVYAFPLPSGAPIFLGIAAYGAPRADLAARFGSQFLKSGFSLTTTPALPLGKYVLAAIAHDTVTGTFNTVRTGTITVALPISNPRMAIDTPPEGAAVLGAFGLNGWAIDTGAPTGSGVDAIHVYAFKSGTSTPIFLGVATLGIARPELVPIFGAQFGTAGYHLDVSGLSAGSYLLWVAARSTVSGQFTGMTRTITVTSSTAMAIDVPGNGSSVTGSLVIGGWALDAAAPSGSGVDAIHVWAVPSNGSANVFLGLATLNVARPDIGAIFGTRFSSAGYSLVAPPLPPGAYTIAVFAHSAATGTFNQMKTVTVIVP